MSNVNPLTVKRFQTQFIDMIMYFMDREDLSLLEAYTKVASMATSEEVIELARKRINELNHRAEMAREQGKIR